MIIFQVQFKTYKNKNRKRKSNSIEKRFNINRTNKEKNLIRKSNLFLSIKQTTTKCAYEKKRFDLSEFDVWFNSIINNNNFLHFCFYIRYLNGKRAKFIIIKMVHMIFSSLLRISTKEKKQI